MPFTLVKGIFKPATGFPDGDSCRFMPFDPEPLFRLPRAGGPPKINPNNKTIQLRFEGIDTMEKQALEPFASDATKNNLKLLGLSGPEDEAPGYILAKQIGPNRRPICFVYAGETEEVDGKETWVDKARLKKSVNFHQLEEGMAYPLFYDTLFEDLRTVLADAARAARAAGRGLWPHDKTAQGVTWSGKACLEHLAPIIPKLWRRLEKYAQDKEYRDNANTLDEFLEYLATKNDRLLLLSQARFAGLDDIVKVEGDVVSLSYLPEDMVFIH